MTKKTFSAVVFSCLCLFAKAQQKDTLRISQFVDFTGTIGASQGSLAGAYVHNWRTGKNRKFEIGLGARLTSYFGTKKDFITAPAKLARTSTFPFAVVFAGQQEANFDTLTVQRPFTTSLNITANFGYNFSSRWYGGVNIDLIGFTLGRKSNAILTSNGNTTTEPTAKASAFNVLLTGDNDFGSLNSEFFLKYNFNNRWSIKAVYQFLFVEYKTTTTKQIAPDGTEVDRFRNKANNFGLGVSYKL